MATHSSVLAWEIPWTEEPGGLQSMALQETDMTQCEHNGVGLGSTLGPHGIAIPNFVKEFNEKTAAVGLGILPGAPGSHISISRSVVSDSL